MPSITSRASGRLARIAEKTRIVTARDSSFTSRTATRTRAPSLPSHRSRRNGRHDHRQGDSKGIIPTRKGCGSPGGPQGRNGNDRAIVAWPAIPRPHDREGDTCSSPPQFVSFTAASFSRASTPLGRTMTESRAESARVYPATEGLSSRSSCIIDTHLDPSASCREIARRSAADGRRTVAAGCDTNVHRPQQLRKGSGRARLAFEELLFVHVLHRRANALKRERRRELHSESAAANGALKKCSRSR